MFCSFTRIQMPTLLQLQNCKTCVGLSRAASTKPQTNQDVQPMLFNRNPRNLERLRIARKPGGYSFENKKVEFWHKLCFESTHKYLNASIVHNNGSVVIMASTQEWAFRKFLYNMKDMCSHITLAKVFAERCLESGINYCYTDLTAVYDTKLGAFLKTLEAEGLVLTEPNTYNYHGIWYKVHERKPWLVQED